MAEPTLEEAKQLPQNNKSKRISKMRALAPFIPQNAVDRDGDAFHGVGGIIANFNNYNASTMNKILADVINIIDTSQQHEVYEPHSPTYSPTTPPSMYSRDDDIVMGGEGDEEEGEIPSLRINIPPPTSSSRNVGTKEDDSGGRSPDIVLEEAAQTYDLTTPVDPNVFLPYQRRVIEAIKQIEAMRPSDMASAQAAQLRRVIQVVYEVFFGIDYTTGQPTDFYTQHGAAPITGMNPTQLTQQATQARVAQERINQNAEDRIGFLRTFLQPLFQRANDPSVADAFNTPWQQQGANTNLASPLNDIGRLMNAVQNIHIAGAHLVQSDPLFIANRHARAQQGDLRVRNWYERIGYWIALNGYDSLRSIVERFGKPGVELAIRMDAVMPAAYKSPRLAIQYFETALGEYNNVYQGLPFWTRLCWTLPYPPGSIGYDQTVQNRSLNKPGAEEFQRAMSLGQGGNTQDASQTLKDARGDILSHPASTYPAFLTLTSGGQVNGPLIAYYYALHGGRMLYQQEGREWLTTAFNANPGRFIQEMGKLVDTMEIMHHQYQSLGGHLGAGFYGQNQAWLNAVQVLESQNPQQRQAAEERVTRSFGTGQVGTITEGGIVHRCKSGKQGRSLCSLILEPLRRTFHSQQSTQQGSRPLMGAQVVEESGDGKQGSRAFRKKVADHMTKEVGKKYAQEQRNIAGETVTEEFLKNTRQHFTTSGNRGNRWWIMDTRQSAENPEESIKSPGILDILNTPAQLYAPVQSTTGKPVAPRQQRFAQLPRELAGVGRGPGLRLWQLLVRNLAGFRNINNPDVLLQRLGQLGTGIVWAAREGTSMDGFDNPAFVMPAAVVRNIALLMLQNPLLRSKIQVDPGSQSTYTEHSANNAIKEIQAQGHKKRGGRKTRRRKKRKKKTRKQRYRRKKTRHRHKKKKRTRKH